MDKQAPPLDKTAIACGLVALGMGLFVVLSALGIIPSRGSDGGTNWIGIIAGMAFVFGGLAVIVQTLARPTPGGGLPSNAPIWIRVALRILSLAIVVSLAAIGTWVAFGPGKREFSSSIPFLPAWLNEPIGRTVFGAGAVLIWTILIVMAVIEVRRFRSLR